MAGSRGESVGRKGPDHPRVLPMKRTLLVLLMLLTAATAFAADPEQMSRREKKDRVAKLSEVHRQFLLDVEPIIVDAERDTFLRLETDAQRDTFIEDFWRRRDIAQGTTNHGFRNEYMARLEYVKDEFGQASSDRGRIYLLYGPPAQILTVEDRKSTRLNSSHSQ